MYTGVVEVHKPTKRRKPHVFSLIFLMVFLSTTTSLNRAAFQVVQHFALLYCSILTRARLWTIYEYTQITAVCCCACLLFQLPFLTPPPVSSLPSLTSQHSGLGTCLSPFSGDTPCWYFFCQHLCLLFSAPMLYPAMFTCKRLWRVVHWLMFCLFPSLFFSFTHSLFKIFISLFCRSHTSLACCHLLLPFYEIWIILIFALDYFDLSFNFHFFMACSFTLRVCVFAVVWSHPSVHSLALLSYCALPHFLLFLPLLLCRPLILPSPSVNLHVPPLLLLIILALIHPTLPRLHLRAWPRPFRYLRRWRSYRRRGLGTHAVDPPLKHPVPLHWSAVSRSWAARTKPIILPNMLLRDFEICGELPGSNQSNSWTAKLAKLVLSEGCG